MPGRMGATIQILLPYFFLNAKFAKGFAKFAKSQPYHLRYQFTLLNPFFCVIVD